MQNFERDYFAKCLCKSSNTHHFFVKIVEYDSTACILGIMNLDHELL